MNNPYCVLNSTELALMLIALSGYAQDQLCQEYGLIEDEFLSRFGNQYPKWFTPAQIEICHTMMRCTPYQVTDFVYVPWTSEALAIEQGPSFYSRHQKLTEIADCLSRYGACLHWNRQFRHLEITLTD